MDPQSFRAPGRGWGMGGSDKDQTPNYFWGSSNVPKHHTLQKAKFTYAAKSNTAEMEETRGRGLVLEALQGVTHRSPY